MYVCVCVCGGGVWGRGVERLTKDVEERVLAFSIAYLLSFIELNRVFTRMGKNID